MSAFFSLYRSADYFNTQSGPGAGKDLGLFGL